MVYAKIISSEGVLGGGKRHEFISSERWGSMSEAAKNTSRLPNVRVVDLRRYTISDDPNLCELCRSELTSAIRSVKNNAKN